MSQTDFIIIISFCTNLDSFLHLKISFPGKKPFLRKPRTFGKAITWKISPVLLLKELTERNVR